MQVNESIVQHHYFINEARSDYKYFINIAFLQKTHPMPECISN